LRCLEGQCRFLFKQRCDADFCERPSYLAPTTNTTCRRWEIFSQTPNSDGSPYLERLSEPHCTAHPLNATCLSDMDCFEGKCEKGKCTAGLYETCTDAICKATNSTCDHDISRCQIQDGGACEKGTDCLLNSWCSGGICKPIGSLDAPAICQSDTECNRLPCVSGDQYRQYLKDIGYMAPCLNPENGPGHTDACECGDLRRCVQGQCLSLLNGPCPKEGANSFCDSSKGLVCSRNEMRGTRFYSPPTFVCKAKDQSTP
jgi:hypothetical protein